MKTIIIDTIDYNHGNGIKVEKGRTRYTITRTSTYNGARSGVVVSIDAKNRDHYEKLDIIDWVEILEDVLSGGMCYPDGKVVSRGYGVE